MLFAVLKKLTLPYNFHRRVLAQLMSIGCIFSLCCGSLSVSAHDIPARVTLYVYVKPEGNRLNVLLRVPMEAFSEINFPTRGPGYLHFAELDSSVENAVRVYITQALAMYENGEKLRDQTVAAIHVTQPSDRSFVDYSSALASIHSPPLTDDLDLYWKQANVDILLSYSIASENSRFALESTLARLGERTNTVMHFVLPDGGERVFNYFGNPGRVELDPSLWQALSRFVVMGFYHILEGMDHLLFLFCLIIPLHNIRQLISVISSFTVAHSITLIGSAFGLVPQALWFPPLIEVLIAISIIYMAFENIVGAKLNYRWVAAFCFGLVHGFGFSFLLAETMQFAGGHLLTSLLAFNVGVEFGQLFVLAITVPLLSVLFTYVVRERIGAILLSALVAHSAWHWMLERGNALLQYQFQWPAFDALLLASVMRWGMLLLVIAGALWALLELSKRLSPSEPKRSPET